jgi:hypothetical protein
MNMQFLKLHLLVFILSLSLFSKLSARYVNDTLYINSGFLKTVDSKLIPFKAFNASRIFSSTNKVLKLQANDTLLLTLYNNDTLPHGFAVWNTSILSKVIQPNTYAELVLAFQNSKHWFIMII